MGELNSLCLTIEKPNKGTYLLRIADYVDGSLVPFSVTQVDLLDVIRDPIYAVYTISVAPNESKAGELTIWRWKPRENEPNKQISYKTSIPFWCLVNLPEISFGVWDNINVIKQLRSGFTVPLNLPDSFLLKVWEGTQTFRVIYLQKKDLLILGNSAKLSENVDTLKCFNIIKNDFITLDEWRISSILQKNHTSNVFYKYVELPEDFDVLSARTFEEQLARFFNTYAKLHHASRKDRNFAKELLVNFIRNMDDINAIFPQLGYYDGNIAEMIVELKEAIDAFLDESNNADQLMTAMVENIPALREKYTQYVREKWLTEKHEERIRIEADLMKKKQELENMMNELMRVCEEKQLIEQTIADLHVTKNDLERQISEFQKSFERKIISAREEIADFLAEVAVYQGTVGIANYTDTSIYRFASELYSNQSHEAIEEINDLLYLLEENFMKAGIMASYKEIVAKFAAYSILSCRPLLVFGCNARAFANAISATICALPADILTLPTMFKDASGLKYAAEESKSNVVLIENAVFGCDENVYLPLVKGKSKKLLLFSVDFEDNIALIPKSILHFMNLINLDLLSENVKKEDYKFGQICYDLPMPQVTDEKLHRYRRILNSFSRVEFLSSIYIQQRAEYLSMWDVLGGKALTTLLICELIPFFIARGKHEELQEFIQEFIREQQLSDGEQKLIDNLMLWK